MPDLKATSVHWLVQFTIFISSPQQQEPSYAKTTLTPPPPPPVLQRGGPFHSIESFNTLMKISPNWPHDHRIPAIKKGLEHLEYSVPPNSTKHPSVRSCLCCLQHKANMSDFLSFLLLSLFFAPKLAVAAAELRHGYYSETCPEAESIVRMVIHRAMIREPRSAASVMRLQFHDCFVNGCDGSVLLDDTPTMLGEKLALSNINSLRDFEVIDEVKEALEQRCPGVVSCADIIIMAARDAVVLSGGPNWEVKLGRKDSLTACQEDSNNIMPSPRANATSLIKLFHQFNLSITDLVALSGSHSIGEARCFSIVFRLYNQSGTGRPDPYMNPEYRKKLDELCPKGGDGNVTGGLDATPVVFDNQYYKDLVQMKGFLNSDQTLYCGDARTRKVVKKFSSDQGAFFSAFIKGMVRMGDLQSDKRGEIRKNCRVVNDRPCHTTL